jgi:signal transduction histidine kinase
VNKQKQSSLPSAIFDNVGSQSSFIKDAQELSIADLIELYAYSEAIVETVREPLIILDRKFRVKSTNNSYLKTFNTTTPNTIGKDFFKLGGGQWNVPILRRLLKKVLPKDKAFEDVEVDYVFPNIGQKIMLLNGRCVVLSRYKTHLILVAIEDITERRLIEKRTEKFISMASHELRTPLTSIKAFMQLLEMKLKDGMDRPTAQIMSRVMRQLNSLNTLIQDLFDVRKIKEGMLVVNKRVQKIGPLIKEAVSLMQLIANDYTISFKGDSEAKVNVDKERIIQVVTNLLNNAVRYSTENKEIRVKLTLEKDNAVVSVQDFGPGIPKANQKHIFDAYYTADQKSGKKSLGLGLYISSEIIHLHEGKIWLKSSNKKGTTFFFSIPTIN